MIGMKEVADEVDSLIAQAEDNQRREAQGLKVTNPTNHLVLSGNPGTGKTTVAESIAELYHGLGILPTNKVTVVDRADLGGRYANDIEANVKDLFARAKGGVVFVDEAYMLANDEFGQRAANQLMKEMEENRKDTVVIVAGYPDDLNNLMSTNPGFARRFPRTIHFPDYSVKDQVKILGKMMADHQDVFDSTETMEHARTAVKHVADLGGNAGGMRNFHEELIKARAQRLRGTNPSPKKMSRFAKDDVNVALNRLGIAPIKSGKLVKREQMVG